MDSYVKESLKSTKNLSINGDKLRLLYINCEENITVAKEEKSYPITRHILNLIQSVKFSYSLNYFSTEISNIIDNKFTVYKPRNFDKSSINVAFTDNTKKFFYEKDSSTEGDKIILTHSVDFKSVLLFNIPNICIDTGLYELYITENDDHNFYKDTFIPIFLPLLKEDAVYQSYKINVQIKSNINTNVMLISSNNLDRKIPLWITKGSSNVISVFSNSEKDWLV